MRYIFLCSFLLIRLCMSGQENANLTIIYDQDRGSTEFLGLIQSEINTLLEQHYTITYNTISLDQDSDDPAEIIETAFNDNSQILITLGFTASHALEIRDEYPKPCIAGISLERSENETTGITNYNYIQSPFSIARDMDIFRSIYDFQHLGIFVAPDLRGPLEAYLNNEIKDTRIQFVAISENVDDDFAKLEKSVDAIYFLPNLYNTFEKELELIQKINVNKLPSFSLIGRADVENGILASISSSDYIGIYARRIALNVMKILEGQNPKDLPIQIGGVENDFVINVQTMQQIDIYPPFEVLSQASFINLRNASGESYSLKSAIAHALSNNLSLQISQSNIGIQDKEIDIAKSNLLPNIEASSSLVTLDDDSAEQLKSTNQLTPQTEWDAKLVLSQLIYSEPAWANLSIQQSLLEAEKQGYLASQLDLVLDVCSAYIQVLLAQANVDIQNNNVQTTLSNLNIAKSKAKIGALSLADVRGFESQLAINKGALNDAQTAEQQARISFNQLLNRPLDLEFQLDELSVGDQVLFIADSRIASNVNNYYDFRKFADFLIDYAINHAPEIQQIDWSIKAQQRSLRSNKNSLFQPQIALQGNADKTIGRYGIRAEDVIFESIGVDPYQPTWNIGLNASLPIFQGNLRRNNIQKDKIIIDQLQTNRDLIEQNFDANIRLSLENLGNSFNNIRYTDEAKQSSQEYLTIIQDLYREGATTIVTLLDAQNNYLSASLGAVTSRYQFVLDAITTERLINRIYLLANEEEKEAFIQEYFDFIIQREK